MGTLIFLLSYLTILIIGACMLVIGEKKRTRLIGFSIIMGICAANLVAAIVETILHINGF